MNICVILKEISPFIVIAAGSMKFKNMKNLYIIVCGMALSLISCGGGSGSADSADSVDNAVDTARRTAVERFDRFMRDYPVADSVACDSLMAVYQPAVGFMMRLTGSSDADSMMAQLAGSQVVAVFQPDVESRMGDLTDLEVSLGNLEYAFSKNLPSLRFPKRVFGIVTPYDQSLMIADTVMFIGLNHYLGADYEGYGGFDDYRRRMKTRSRLPYDVAEALVCTTFPFDDGNRPTVASRMLYEGAVVKAVLDAVAGAAPADALGYTPQQYEWAESHEAELWHDLVGREMVYSIDPTVAERLVAPAPYTSVFSPESPGRIGRYIGLKLVESYLEKHPGVSVGDILSKRIYAGEGAVVDTGYSPK